MSILVTHRTNESLSVVFKDDFNLRTTHVLQRHLDPGISVLQIDLNACRFLDSEAVIFMHRWQNEGKKLELIDPPDILFQILDILELRNKWDEFQTKFN